MRGSLPLCRAAIGTTRPAVLVAALARCVPCGGGTNSVQYPK